MSATAVLAFVRDIEAGNIKAISERLLKRRESPNVRCLDVRTVSGATCTLLHRAVLAGTPEIVALLLKAGADANSRDSNRQRTPLHWLAAAVGSKASLPIAGVSVQTGLPFIE